MYNITVGQLEQNTDIINLCLNHFGEFILESSLVEVLSFYPSIKTVVYNLLEKQETNQNMGLNDINSGQVFNIILTSVSDNN
jgi:hypothetical protein